MVVGGRMGAGWAGIEMGEGGVSSRWCCWWEGEG